MRLIDVYAEPQAPKLLYELLKERDPHTWISHSILPTFEAHCTFVESRPFRLWLLIRIVGFDVGAIEVTDRNECGIAVLKRFQGHGYGRLALQALMREYSPLPAIPAIRNGQWLANVAIGNTGSMEFFRKMGFVPIQTTLVKRND